MKMHLILTAFVLSSVFAFGQRKPKIIYQPRFGLDMPLMIGVGAGLGRILRDVPAQPRRAAGLPVAETAPAADNRNGLLGRLFAVPLGPQRESGPLASAVRRGEADPAHTDGLPR